MFVSCASLNSIDNKSFKYIGKLLLNYEDNNSATFNININLFKDGSIIQIKKPIYGNVLNIRTYKNQKISITPLKYNQYIKIPYEIEINLHNWLSECLLKNSFNINKSEDKFNYEFICNENKNKIFFKIKYQEYILEGYIIQRV